MTGEAVNQAVAAKQTFVLGEQFSVICSKFFGLLQTQSTSRIDDRATIKGRIDEIFTSNLTVEREKTS